MKPTTKILRQLTATPLDNGKATILRNGAEIGHLTRARSPYGLCYEIELGGKPVSASRDIPNALENAAVHIWRAEHAAEDAEWQAAQEDRAEMRMSLRQF